jgi:hypothetical protein
VDLFAHRAGLRSSALATVAMWARWRAMTEARKVAGSVLLLP